MTGEVAQIQGVFSPDTLASEIANKYQTYDNQRVKWKEEKRELRNYLFATDTTKTSNSKLPWTNKTTTPKLCQIRDTLHANYMSALFPNDDWLRWEAFGPESVSKEKREAIQFYMRNKLYRSDFKNVISKVLYDYIDYGNCFVEAEYVKDYGYDSEGNRVITYQGPRAVRRSVFDVVFNPVANSFSDTWYITRALVSVGELTRNADRYEGERAETARKALERVRQFRSEMANYSSSDIDKAIGIEVDGFGSYSQYLESDYVEILEFRGDLYFDGEMYENYVISVVDRAYLLYKEPNSNMDGEKPLIHGGWRYRPDNLYAMGPLDNIVGMQYRIDHLENLRADIFDIIAAPPLKIKGVVQEFEWEPYAQIECGDDGDVEPLEIPAAVLQADTQIAILEQRMEEYAGAPKQSIGIRTPGEKTAFEVNVLEQNSNKLFQEKVQQFEVQVLEPLLNKMLAQAREYLDEADLISVLDDKFAIQEFKQITKADLNGEGKIRPIGARHFLKRNMMVQNYMGFRQLFGADPAVMNHISGLGEARMLEDLLGIEAYELVRENVRVAEAADSQRQIQSQQAALQEEASIPADEDQAEAQRGLNAS